SPPQDRSDVYSMNMLVALAGGITTVLSGNDVAKLTFGSIDDMVIREGAFVNLNYSSSRPLERRELWNDLTRVRDYLRDVRNWEINKKRDEEAKEPDKEWLKGKFEGYRKLLDGQAVAMMTANGAQELRDVAELARHFGIRVVVRGGIEAWTVAPELGRAGVSAIITPRDTYDPDPKFNRPTGSSIENARILHEHGVPVAIIPGTTGITYWGLAGRDLLHTNMEAAFAVRGGLSNEDALRTITIDAARILGVDDQVGSLEVGKDGDMIVTDGDPLSFMTQVHYAVVNGRVAYDKSKDTLFAHIRPTGEVKPVEFDDYWPRQLEWPADIPTTNPPEPEATPEVKPNEQNADGANSDSESADGVKKDDAAPTPDGEKKEPDTPAPADKPGAH
ncbi:MAG: amidohydrolase family protein, partial [Phycisphaerales bacterium]|nr:amidohydrolase family protein [Phycisphaerales bacterium]